MRQQFLLFVLTALALLVAYRLQQPVLTANIGSSTDLPYGSLFGGREQNNEATFRWSGQASTIHLYGFEGRPALLRMRISATRPVNLPEAQLTLTQGIRPLGGWQVGRSWRSYNLLLPATRLSEQTLLLTSTTFEPGGHDERSLGVALDTLHAEALRLPLTLPPPLDRWLFLSLLPPLLNEALRRLRPIRRYAFGAALVLLGGLAFGVAQWPTTTALLLPNIWATFTIAVVLLALPPLRSTARSYIPQLTTTPNAFGLALLLLLGGLALLAERHWLPGALFAASGLFLLVLSFPDNTPTIWPDVSRGITILTLMAVTLLALGLRLWQLDVLPLGIWQDEARHGLLALRLLNDPSYRPVYASEADLPALAFYAIAPSLWLFDVSPWSLRLPMALAGTLLPLALFALARLLIGRTTALIAAILVACASWSLSLSRIAWPTIFDPLLLSAGLALLWYALQSQTAWVALALALSSGILTGLDLYTYHTGRLAPLAGLWMLLVFVWHRRTTHQLALSRVATITLCWSIAVLLLAVPLVNYAQEDPQGFSKRISGVALLGGSVAESGSPTTLIESNALRYLGMLHIAGDPNGRHHIPNRPLLDPLSGTLLLVGILWALRTRPIGPLLLGWLALGTAAGVLSVGGPHAMRAVGTLAPALMLAAIGLRETTGYLLGTIRNTKNHLISYTGIVVLTAIALLNAWLYFGLLPHDPQHVRAFRPVATRMGYSARQIAFEPAHPTVYLPAAQLEAEEARLFTVGVRGVQRLEDATSFPAKPVVLLLPATTPTQERNEALAQLGLSETMAQPGGYFPDTGEVMFWIYRSRRREE